MPKKDAGEGAYYVVMRPPEGAPQFTDEGRQLEERVTVCAAESEAHAREQAVDKALGQEEIRGCVYQVVSIEKIG